MDSTGEHRTASTRFSLSRLATWLRIWVGGEANANQRSGGLELTESTGGSTGF
jgi:hypothetical protein